MKKIRTIFSLLSLSLLAISCGLDNYDEPESFLQYFSMVRTNW